MVQFTDENIRELFGAEDAENEDPKRLKEIFFRNKAYDNLVSNIPIRVLVGHKGVGKSALLKVAYLEDVERGIPAIWFQPGDLMALPISRDQEFTEMIETWKVSLINLIFQRVVEEILPGNNVKKQNNIKGTVSSLIIAIKGLVDRHAENITTTSAKKILESFRKNNMIRVYLDDLDRGWDASRFQIQAISALLNAIRDLCGSEKNLHFRLGLRSDVYFIVRTSDESTDKIEQNIIWLIWDNHEILVLMVKRIETFHGREFDEKAALLVHQTKLEVYLHPIITDRFNGMGKWENAPIRRVLLSLTRKRPRDLIKLLSAAARQAYRHDRQMITTQDLRDVFEVYSAERLQDIINEFNSELPEISKLVHGMRPSKKERTTAAGYLYTNDRLITKIKNIMQQANFSFTNGNFVTAKSLAEFLYKIDFITARRDENGKILRKNFEQNRYLMDQFADYGFDWEIHMAYRWALQPQDVKSIFRFVDLGDDG